MAKSSKVVRLKPVKREPCAEVISMLYELLDMAERGEILSIAAVYECPTFYEMNLALGHTDMVRMIGMLERLKGRLTKRMDDEA